MHSSLPGRYYKHHLLESLEVVNFPTAFIQLFRERSSEKVKRQSRKVLWVVLSSLFFKEI